VLRRYLFSGDKLVRTHLVAVLLMSAFFVSVNAQTTTLIFASQDFPPFNVEINGKASGPFVDIVNVVCRRIQINCIVETLPWRRGIAEVEEGRLNGAFPLIRFPEREQFFYLLGPIANAVYAVYAGAGDTLQYHDAKDLLGYTIAAYGPSGTSLMLEQVTSGMPSVKRETEISNLTVLKKLSVGRYGSKGLGFLNRDVAQYLIAQEHIENVHLAGAVKVQEYYIGLSRKSVSPEVEARFSAALAALTQSGELVSILKKYGLEVASDKMVN